MIRSSPNEPGRIYLAKRRVHIPRGTTVPCRDNPAPYFNDKASDAEAGRLCSGCPVRTDCLLTALANNEPAGVWGGTNPSQRRAIRRKGKR